MYQIQATVAMEQKQMRLNMIATATFYIDLYRGTHKIFRQELPMSIPKEEFSYKQQCREDLQ